MAIERENLFGTDLQLMEIAAAMDVVADPTGDLALARGNANIVQALTMRLLVRKGELARLGWPNYGSRLHELIGEPNNQRTRTILMAHARAAIEQDPRVEEVTGVVARVPEGERDTVRLDIEIQLINENHPLNLVFDVKLGTA
ncbi:MAG TPA: GPW/gp25 family protein [Blastocatellia bacterium]|nr:GPW/gp25 family protein [Blastocatellia bacterium]HMY75405.1 GPW/gp25 family protein [Blastocatellia bacterium]HMZ17725.1 GPW/gp25 family protein [Blastocatellia bacterium]HNG33990.1 GPW/gp25 family protein [Blastocatellia bacterium]